MAYLDIYNFDSNVGFESIFEKPETAVATYYTSLKKKKEFLYELTYNSLDYDYAIKYFNTHPEPVNGSCSAMRQGNFVGRNYDWKYDNEPSFIVKTPNCQGHKAVIGTAGNLPELSRKVVENRTDTPLYKVIPFRLLDGINEDGLMVEANVVPGIGTKKTTPKCKKNRVRMSAYMLVRYILDNYKSVDDAIKNLKEHVEIYYPKPTTTGYELHWMLSDMHKTVVLEIINNKIVVTDASIMTNFHIHGVTHKEDGSVYSNIDVKYGNKPTKYGIDSHGSGLERYNILNSLKDGIINATDMRNAMNSIFYSNSYTKEVNDDFWYSEMVGNYVDYDVEITVDTSTEDHIFIPIIAAGKQKWENRDRNHPEVWHTCHSCVYDLAAKTFSILVQEESAEYEVSFSDGSVSSLEDKINALAHSLAAAIEGGKSVDAALAEAIEKEQEERIAEDEILSDRIDEISSGIPHSVIERIEKLEEDLIAERDDRRDDEKVLLKGILDEIGNRESADELLSERIDNIVFSGTDPYVRDLVISALTNIEKESTERKLIDNILKLSMESGITNEANARKEAIDNLKSSVESGATNINKRVTENSNSIISLSASTKDTKAKLSELDIRLGNAISAATTEISNLGKRISDANTKINTLSGSVQNAEKLAEEAKKGVGAVTDSVAEIREKTDAIGAVVEDVIVKVAEHDDRIKALEGNAENVNKIAAEFNELYEKMLSEGKAK